MFISFIELAIHRLPLAVVLAGGAVSEDRVLGIAFPGGSDDLSPEILFELLAVIGAVLSR